jgi:hypothetical protein
MPGWQMPQLLAGLDAPDAYVVPPISHWVPQFPPTHT